MDLMQKIGGRKFVLAILVAMFAGYLEVATQKGLTTTMAGFLIALVGAFSAANFATTANFRNTSNRRDDEAGLDTVVSKLDTLTNMAREASNPEAVNQLTGVLVDIQNNIGQLQAVSGQMGQSVVNLTKDVARIKRDVSQPTTF